MPCAVVKAAHVKMLQIIKRVRQEIDGLQVRHLQLAFYLHFMGQEKWASGRTLRTSPLLAFPDTGGRWAPGQTFKISLLFAL